MPQTTHTQTPSKQKFEKPPKGKRNRNRKTHQRVNQAWVDRHFGAEVEAVSIQRDGDYFCESVGVFLGGSVLVLGLLKKEWGLEGRGDDMSSSNPNTHITIKTY